ncbi:PaaI family thioesterase [Peribacillus frigoritolerans]|uniref:PaaI family thioesterase n=1 Tax=Peribacillus frigoritolerans TaxID=450367 RepID=UPI0021CF0D7E|nr:PaaI family thioesterase [Peribacillus frigoritolerans]MCU6598968.1 PaaI family thioesterase [Peribacillus frigoritolerans]
MNSIDKNSLNKFIEENPFLSFLGVNLVKFEEGKVVTELPVAPYLINRKEVVHGGVFATMLDNTIALTARSILDFPVSTISLNINYLANIGIGGGKLVATAKILQQSYRILTGEGEITDETGKLLAKGSATFKIIRNA